ncbi:MAG: AIR synthase family protein [Dehalococcoidia bacterium]
MRTGKLPPELLSRLLKRIRCDDPRVRLGPQLGEDAAAIDTGGETLIVSTDPVTFVTDRAAWYAVQVNANDVAAMGAEPAWFAATVLLPSSFSEPEAERLFEQLQRACEAGGVALVTGHTEVTPAVTRPVIVGTMLGTVDAGSLVTSGGALPGDAVILAGPIAIEGTAVLATEAAAELAAGGFAPGALATAAGLLDAPGVSVVRASRLVRDVTRPHAMHDATEGGVAMALREVALASGVGMSLNLDRVPMLDLTRRVCQTLRLNPLGLISSGCLIVVVDRVAEESVLGALSAGGIEGACIGGITAAKEMTCIEHGLPAELPPFDRDELARYFDERASARA